MGFDFYQRDPLGRIDRRDLSDARYSRADVRGMPVLVECMLATGVLDAHVAAPRLPERPDSQPVDAWLRAAEAVRMFRAPDLRRVPLAKLCTNDAWVVTPSECESIADALEAALVGAEARARGRPLSTDARTVADAKVRLLRSWIAFQRRSARAGGYEVW